MYGTLRNGILTLAPTILKVDGRVYYNPSHSMYTSLGYLPLVDTPAPEIDDLSPKYYEEQWVEQDGKIVKVYIEVEPPITEETAPTEGQTTDERIAALESRVTNVEDALVKGII